MEMEQGLDGLEGGAMPVFPQHNSDSEEESRAALEGLYVDAIEDAFDGEDEVNRKGSLCWRILAKLRMERCFEKPVAVPKKGEPIGTVSLKVPLTTQFVREQEKAGAQKRRNNSVRTSKYSVWTFVPFSVAHQFRRFVNMFFLVIVILLIVGNIWPKLYLTPWQATGTAVYLSILVVAGMLVEGLDDLQRHRGDRLENRSTVERVNFATGELIETQWGRLLPGDLIVVNDHESFPADVLVLYATANDNRNMCYIETSSIDGETNLKIKDVPHRITNRILPLMDKNLVRFSNAEKTNAARVLSMSVQGMYEYEQPNAFLQFNGSFLPRHGPNKEKISLEFNNLVLRGSTLRNTKWLIGMVMYAGAETKLALSRQIPRAKFSTIDRLINKLMWVMLVFYLAIVILADGLLFLEPDTDQFWYFQFTSSTTGYVFPGPVAFFVTFCILFSNFIPISLVLLVEILNKYFQFIIDNDIEMYHEETDTPASCKTASLSAEIGQITHFFSDKTGTLTRNEMKLVGCFVEGMTYGYLPPEVDTTNTEQQPHAQGTNPNLPSIFRSDEDEVTNSNVVEEEGGKSILETLGSKGIDADEVFKDAVHLLRSPDKKDSKERRDLFDFLLFLGVCHTVLLDKDPETGAKTFNAESPDEEAFVKGIHNLGFTLVHASDGIIQISTPDGDVAQKYQILAVNPFNSSRKRMSLVICREDGSLAVLMKGADNVMFERVVKRDPEMERRLLQYAWGGLRTLVMAKRELSEEEFLKWQIVHNEAMVVPSAERSNALAKAAEQIENEMTLVGATAIEDQLQHGVPEAIQTLRDAGIQVWVVTGDKIETAINIGLSSRLLDSKMYQLKLISNDQSELERLLDLILSIISNVVDEIQAEPGSEHHNNAKSVVGGVQEGKSSSGRKKSMSENNKKRSSSSSASSKMKSLAHRTLLKKDDQSSIGSNFDMSITEAYTTECLALIISGEALELLLATQKGSAQLEHKLLCVARCCKVVLACRTSPKQKSLIVSMVKDAPDNKTLKRKPITLAIGDGANDVPMIQTAHVGVGISGHEGRQAVNSSDFSIAQFRFVVRLLLIHGRWNYRRQATVLIYLVYCWLLYIFNMYIFQPFCLWSGQQVYYEYYYTFFAPFLLNFAIIAHGWFNKDLGEKFVMQYPFIYYVGAKNKDLNMKRLFASVMRTGLHLLLFYLFIFLTSPLTTAQATFGSTMFTTLYFVLYYDQLSRGRTFNVITLAAFVFLMICFLVGMGLVTVPPFIFSSEADAALAWTQLFLVLVTAVVMDFAYIWIRKEYFPSSLDTLAEMEHDQRKDVGSLREDIVHIPYNTFLNALKRVKKKSRRLSSRMTASQEEADVEIEIPTVPSVSSSSAAAAKAENERELLEELDEEDSGPHRPSLGTSGDVHSSILSNLEPMRPGQFNWDYMEGGGGLAGSSESLLDADENEQVGARPTSADGSSAADGSTNAKSMPSSKSRSVDMGVAYAVARFKTAQLRAKKKLESS